MEEAEKNFAEATEAVAQAGPLRAKIAKLEGEVTRLQADRDDAVRERDKAIVARQETASKALAFGGEAFTNTPKQVAVLNLGVPLRTVGANIAFNALSGVLVEYNSDKSHHEVRVVLEAIGVPEI